MSTPFVDGFFVADEAARELRAAPPSITLRADLPAGAGGATVDAPDFGPKPIAPHTLELTKSSRSATLDGEVVTLASIEVTSRELSWSGASGGYQRGAAEIVVSLASASGKRDLVVAEALGDDQALARTELEPLRAALEAYTGLAEQAEPLGEHAVADGDVPSSRPSPRFSVGFEGDAVVVRDHESPGPRQHVNRYRALALFSLLLAIGASFAFIAQLRDHAPLTSMIGFGAAIPVSLLGAIAMFEIARYASKYSATSAPLAWFADDRVVVAPWVSRDGAVNRAPEGRFGAAIAPREITAVDVREAGQLFAVTLDGPHGPIEVLQASERDVARRYQIIIERILRAVSAPKRRALG